VGCFDAIFVCPWATSKGARGRERCHVAERANTRARSVPTESKRALDSFVWRFVCFAHILIGKPVPTADQVRGKAFAGTRANIPGAIYERIRSRQTRAG